MMDGRVGMMYCEDYHSGSRTACGTNTIPLARQRMVRDTAKSKSIICKFVGKNKLICNL